MFTYSALQRDMQLNEDVARFHYIKSGDGMDNPYITVNGRAYRPRVEVLIFDKSGNVNLALRSRLNKYGYLYDLPGGGVDLNKTFYEQCAAECREEIRVEIKNIRFTGQTYLTDFKGNYPKWHIEKLWPYGLRYEGSKTYVFTADYEGKYMGHIDDIDKDEIITRARFQPPTNVNLRPEHVRACEDYAKKHSGRLSWRGKLNRNFDDVRFIKHIRR